MVVRRIGRGPEVIWIHGLGERSRCFDAVVGHRLLEGFTHVLPDLPGYGESQPPVLAETGDSLVDLAAHLADWLTTWPAREPPIIAGHSMGGVLATLVAERIPVRGVLDIDGNLSRGDCTFSAEACAHDATAFETIGFPAMRARVAAEGKTDPALAGYAEAMRQANAAVFHRNAVDLVALSTPETLVARLAALRVPVMFIAGVPDGICAHSRSLLGTHGVPWVGIEPAGHWPFIDQRDAFAAAARAFFRDVMDR
jgi:pimeloyl-ACP methyl ester carboxylesterase